jgi:predicted RNase H-like nuclease (RuvC/YqgF family)
MAEVRKSFSEAKEDRRELRSRVDSLAQEIVNDRVSESARLERLENGHSSLHQRVDETEGRVEALERRPGLRAGETLGWVAKTAGYFLIGAVLLLIGWGLQVWLGSGV